MKEAIVHPGTRVEIVDSPIPSPEPDEVEIRVKCSGCNPKGTYHLTWIIRLHVSKAVTYLDFKVPEWTRVSMNQGDDIAGIVHSVGKTVTEFKPGDRVAAFHEFLTPHGSWAEYAVTWGYTTFHLPNETTFEGTPSFNGRAVLVFVDSRKYIEAATIPLAAMTAAVAIYLTLGLPEPWRPAQNQLPLLIYGASGAVGSFAIQLAQLSNIHPIIAVAGKARDHVEGLIDRSKGDVICDYRNGDTALVSEIRDALEVAGLSGIKYAFDCMSEKAKGSYPNILKVLDRTGHIALIQNYDPRDMPADVTITRLTVRWVHQDINTYSGLTSGPEETHSLMGSKTGCREFGCIMYRFFGRVLSKGFLKGHPHRVVPGGLNGVEPALRSLKAGEASGIKYIFRIEDTEMLD